MSPNGCKHTSSLSQQRSLLLCAGNICLHCSVKRVCERASVSLCDKLCHHWVMINVAGISVHRVCWTASNMELHNCKLGHCDGNLHSTAVVWVAYTAGDSFFTSYLDSTPRLHVEISKLVESMPFLFCYCNPRVFRNNFHTERRF